MLFAFSHSGLCLVFVVSVFDLSSVLYFPACTNGNGTVQPNCADVTFRLHSLTHSATSACCEAEDIDCSQYFRTEMSSIVSAVWQYCDAYIRMFPCLFAFLYIYMIK